MAELFYEHPTSVRNGETTYIVRIFGEERSDGIWEGWLEFYPLEKGKPLLRAGRETTQPSRVAIEYWAFGLEPVYLEGALDADQHP